MNKAINIAKFFQHLGELNKESDVHGEEMNRMISTVLRGFGYDKDSITCKRTKLVDESYLYYVELRTGKDVMIIDPKLEGAHRFGAHPRASEFKGRGRNRIQKLDDAGDLNVAMFLREFLALPKVASSTGRDDPCKIGFRTKDLRNALRKKGFVPSYDNVAALMASMEEAEAMDKVRGYFLNTGYTMYEWHTKGLTVADFIYSLEQKYVRNMQATG